MFAEAGGLKILKTATVEELNDVKENGFVEVSGTSSDNPPIYQYGFALVLQLGWGFVQIYFPDPTIQNYLSGRKSDNTGWTEWAKL